MSQKVIKWTKDGGYCDYSCKGLLYFNGSFWFHFYCFVDGLLYFLRNKFTHYGTDPLFTRDWFEIGTERFHMRSSS